MSTTLRLMHYLHSIKNESPTPPGPSYNYILLNDFITPMPTPMPNPYSLPGDDNFLNIIPSEWDSDYQTSDLVSNIAGSQMLDSDTPVDFSSKNISTGTPFGIVTWDSCPKEICPRYAITEGSLSNGCTIELWYKSDFTINQEDNAWLANIGVENNNARSLLLSMNESQTAGYSPTFEYSVTLRLNTSSTRQDYDQTITTDWLDGNWHHYAITYDATTHYVHFFLDGHKEKSITDASATIQDIFTNATHVDFAQSDGYDIPKGRFAQIAVCDVCKWTDDFTVPTVAY